MRLDITVNHSLFVGVLVFAIAALVYVVRYVLLVINRNTLLNSWVAAAAAGADLRLRLLPRFRQRCLQIPRECNP